MKQQRTSFRLFARVLWTLGLFSLLVIPGPSGAQPKSRQQQIAEIEKQIAELTRKLVDLRKSPPSPSPGGNGTIPAEWIKALHWRSIGPAAMGGRIVALSVFEADPTTYWVATASGGLLKTVNSGTTFEHQFDRESTVSIGDVCVAPSDRNIVWVGTGENNPRNSVSYGDGVYKSTDGGKTWKNMGLQKTFQIGRIVVHPKNPDIVYVGALGRLYGPNEDRGLFKTSDGGKTWKKVLFVDDQTGVIDVQMSPADPETLLVAMWERLRDGYDSHPGPAMPNGYDSYDPIKKWGKGTGLYKTTDGFKTYKKITQGLPTVMLGRMGIDFYRKDPKTVFLIVDSEKYGMGPPPNPVFMGIRGTNEKNGARLTEITDKSPAAKAGLQKGDVITAMDNKPIANYGQLAQGILSHKAGDKVVLKVVRGKETKDITVTLENRPQPPAPPAAPFVGIGGKDGATGLLLTEVGPRSPAARAGLKVNDIIQTVDKKKVTTFLQMAEQLVNRKPGEKVTLQVLRGNDVKEIVLTLGPRRARPLPPNRPYAVFLGGQMENVQDKQGKDSFQYGGVYKSTDAGDTWTRLNSINPRPMYFSQVRVDPSDDKYLYVLGIQLYRSKDGGKTFSGDGGRGVHPDQHALWIDPRDGRHMIVGCDGGFYVTHDRMEHWDYLNHLAIAQFYHVAVDNRQPYHVYGGLQDNGSWGGPSRGLDGQGPINADWIVVHGGDGFVCRVDANDSDVVYAEHQDGNIIRRNLRSGRQDFLGRHLPKGGPYRFNWNTPLILSSRNPRIFYCGGNYVFRSLNRGEDLRIISPEITLTKWGSATALAESPRNPDVLYAGTDDGALWITRDGAAKWTNITKNVGLPGPRWVATIEASHFIEGRAYVVFDAHRSNDDEPYVFVTEDFGQTWKSIRANLPSGSSRVLREDVDNPNLLFVGTEFAVWASINRGVSWTKVNNNLPTVAIHELAIHPTAGEMVAATHGRSLWVLDITPLRQMTAPALKAKAHLFQPQTVVRWRSKPSRGSPFGTGSRRFVGENPPPGMLIYYALTEKAAKGSLKVLDYAGKTVADIKPILQPGLHRAPWNMIVPVPPGPRRRSPYRWAAAGMYRVVLNLDGQDYTQSVRIQPDPTLPANLIASDEVQETPKRKKEPSRIDD